MTLEAKTLADFIERIARDLLAQLAGISDELLNRPTPIPDSNTLYGVATHTVGMGEFWVLALVGGWPIARNRSLEFRASGTSAELIARFERWIKHVHQVLDDLPASKLDEPVYPPAEFLSTGGFADSQSMTARDCLLHVVEHSATHLGHIQLTIQMFAAIERGQLSVKQ